MQRLRASSLSMTLLKGAISSTRVGSCPCTSNTASLFATAFRPVHCPSALAHPTAPQLPAKELSRYPIGWRPFSGSVCPQEAAKSGRDSKADPQKGAGLVQQTQTDDITDQIPEIVKPMGVVEGTSYTLLILAGLAFAAAVVWAAASELLFQPKEYTCFNLALAKLQEDPRVTVRLGTPVSGFGQDTRNRQARQRIPNRIYKDAEGVEHVQIQFFARGPSATGRVSAEMYQDSSKEWQYRFMYLDIDHPYAQRIKLVELQNPSLPRQSSGPAFSGIG